MTAEAKEMNKKMIERYIRNIDKYFDSQYDVYPRTSGLYNKLPVGNRHLVSDNKNII